jgi:3-oxoacyl-[acyl-carrier-protein] synthase III
MDPGMDVAAADGETARRPVTVGIAAIGTHFPEGVETSREMAARSGFPEYVFVDKIGVRQKPVAAPDEHPSDLGLAAARDALARAALSPEAVDVVVYCGGAFYDYGVWSPAARIAHEIGALNAFAYEVKNGCNGGNLGLHVASRQLLDDPDLEWAVVVCSDTFSRLVNFADERLITLFHCADGATAAVLRKNHPGNRVLAYAGITDGSFVDAIRVPLGGTRVPWQAGGHGGELGCWQIEDPDRLAFVFSDLYLRNYVRVVREAVRKCGRTVADIDFLFTNQVKASTLDAIFAKLGLAPEKTCRTLERYGHLAASDTLLALAQTLAAGRIRTGDLVVLASSGTGFNWGATVVQY